MLLEGVLEQGHVHDVHVRVVNTLWQLWPLVYKCKRNQDIATVHAQAVRPALGLRDAGFLLELVEALAGRRRLGLLGHRVLVALEVCELGLPQPLGELLPPR